MSAVVVKIPLRRARSPNECARCHELQLEPVAPRWPYCVPCALIVSMEITRMAEQRRRLATRGRP